MDRAPDDPESLTDPLSERIRGAYNEWACVHDKKQYGGDEHSWLFSNLVWSVLLGLDSTEFRLVHVSEFPDAPSVSDRVTKASTMRRIQPNI